MFQKKKNNNTKVNKSNLDKDSSNIQKLEIEECSNIDVIIQQDSSQRNSLRTESNIQKSIEPINIKKKKSRNRFSFSDILLEDEKKKETNLNIIKKSQDFSEEQMLQAWKIFSEKVKDDGKTNLYITLTAVLPTLSESTISLKISNDTQQKILDENEIELLSYLRNVLQNDFIKLKTQISKEIKSNKPYTPTDKFNKMAEDNPSLKILQQKLGLDPEY